MDSQNQVIRVISGERHTPFAVARRLGAVAMLESATSHGGRARYSVIVVREAFRLFQRGDDVLFATPDGVSRVQSSGRDILDVLPYFADQHVAPLQDFPFPAGGVGYLSYAFAARCDTISLVERDDELGAPEAAFLFGHAFVVFDHYSDLIYLIGLNYREAAVDLDGAIDELEAAIGGVREPALDGGPFAARVSEGGFDRAAYEAGVAKVREEIIAGNLLQGVLSRRLQVATEMPAWEAYRRLRQANPAPYLFFLDFGAFQLFGASPETHVKVRGGRAVVHPIAGTRRRGATEDEDVALEKELLADEKERAEHLMLVDLARNDLGRVSVPGSVRVASSFTVERYTHVMHIVSEVEGRLRDGFSGLDALRATFPAGTVSGAPKIRAIETIDRIEPTARGFYAGVAGYVEPGGNLDTCITIRSAFVRDGVFTLQAGAGVVFDSIPAREYDETSEKLAALVAAVGLEVDA